MRIIKSCWAPILLLTLGHPAFAAIRPSFRLDYSSWHATHVVLVSTTPVDGTFEIVESWKGDLNIGGRLVVPELRPDANAVPISRYPTEWADAIRGELSEQIPRQPVGSRMVLFLKSSSTEEQMPPNKEDKPGPRRWKPSDVMDTMKASVVWIDGDKLYCFTQLMNPGPSVLSALPYSEGRLRNRVAEIDGIQKNMTAALAAKDEDRAERLKPCVLSDVLSAQMFALEELGKSGPSAVRTIRGMLDDPAFADEASELVRTLVQAGGESVGEELNNRLHQELVFWKSTAPSLSQDWWNEDTRLHAPLRERYDQTYELLVGLEQTHYSAALNNAMQLRDLWRSLPQLSDYKRLPEECDKLIGRLHTN